MIIYKEKKYKRNGYFSSLRGLYVTNQTTFSIIIWLACDKGYTGPNCEMKCPHPLYGESCQMICNCIGKICDPVNGCNITSSGILHVFLIAYFLVCHLQLYINVCKV